MDDRESRQKKIKAGDYIMAYHKGYWRVDSVQNRDGDAPGDLIFYTKVLDANLKKCSKRKNSCDEHFCRVLDVEFFDQKILEYELMKKALCNFRDEVLSQS